MTTIPDTYQPVSWLEQAACATEDPDLFHLPGDPTRDDTETRYADQITDAKAVCARCPVRDQCLAEAMALAAARDRWAIAGGTTPRERASLRRKTVRDRNRPQGGRTS